MIFKNEILKAASANLCLSTKSELNRLVFRNELIIRGKSSTTAVSRNSSYCVNLVKKYDYEGYLSTLLIPQHQLRSRIFAVKAFNTEVSLVRDLVSDPARGSFRLTFWKNCLEQLFENPKCSIQQPVIQELREILAEQPLSKKWFFNLVNSRERVVADAPFETIEQLESYCDQSVTPVLYLSLELAGIKDLETDHVASHLGKAVGISNFIRSIPYSASKERVLIPQDILIKHKLAQENLIRASNTQKIQDCVYDIASCAFNHYQHAKKLKKGVRKNALPIFLTAYPSELYLNRLQNAGFNPFDKSLTTRYGLLPFHLFYRNLMGIYY